MRVLRQLTAAAVSSALVLLSPGLGCYEALAQTRSAPGGVPTAVPVVGGLTGAVQLQVSPLSSLPSTLGATPALPAPTSVPLSPIGGEGRVRGLSSLAISPHPTPLPQAGEGELARAKDVPSQPGARHQRSILRNVPATGEPAGESRLGRRVSLERHLDAWRRLGAGRAAEEIPDSVPGVERPKGAELAPASRAGEKAAAAQPESPAPPEGEVRLPRSLWGLFWGHHILTIFGINFHMLSQPFLVTQTLSKSKSLMGMVRNVHMGSMSFVNVLPIGWLIDKVDFRVLFIATSAFRALLMGAIPLLFMAGHLSFAVLVGIVAVNPLFQSTMIVADGAARKAFLGTDERLNKEAAAILTKWDSVAGMVFPILSGLLVGGLVSAFGLGGYALAYGVYAVALLAAIPVYWLMVSDPRDRSTLAVTTVGQALRLGGRGLWWLAKLPFWTAPRAAYRWLASKSPREHAASALEALAAAYKGVRGLFRRDAPASASETVGWKESLARRFDRWEATKGIAYILRNKTLSVLMMVGAIEAFLADAMPMVVLPNFIIDAIGESSFQIPWLPWALGAVAGLLALRPVWRLLSRRIPWPRRLQRLASKKPVTRADLITAGVLSFTLALLAWQLPAMLAAAGGIFSLMLAAEYFGRLISSSRLEGQAGDRLIQRLGHGTFYRVAAMSASLFWLMWLFPAILTPGNFWANLGAVLFVQFGMQLAHAPVGIVMAPIVRREIPDDMLGRVDSAFNMVDLIFMAAGALVAGLAVDLLPINTAMLAIAILITGTGILEWFVPKWIFPDGNHPAPKAEKDGGGPAKTARLFSVPALAFA